MTYYQLLDYHRWVLLQEWGRMICFGAVQEMPAPEVPVAAEIFSVTMVIITIATALWHFWPRGVSGTLRDFMRLGPAVVTLLAVMAILPELDALHNKSNGGPAKGPDIVQIQTNATTSAGMAERELLGLPPPLTNRLSQAQYDSGLALVAAAEPPQGWTNMPPGAVLCWTGGVSEAVLWLPMAGWRHPVRGMMWDGAYVFSSGVVSLGDLCDELDGLPLPDGAARFPVFAVMKGEIGFAPGIGKVWYLIRPGSVVITWDTVYLNRDSAFPATVQMELFRNGDMAFRYALLDANADYSAVLPAFRIGAQNNGAGEGAQLEITDDELGITNTDIFNLKQPNANPLELELRWRGFGILDPEAEDGDSDEDGLTDWEEIFITGTNPLNKDTDGDGVSDLWEIALGLEPLNPDTDGDGAVDADDPAPLAAYGGQNHAGWLFRVINRLPANTPLPYTPQGPGWFKVTVALNAPLDPPAVLWFGEGGNARRVLLRETGTWEVWLNKGWNAALRVASIVPVLPDMTITADDPTVVIQYTPPDWLERERDGEPPAPGNGTGGNPNAPPGGGGGNPNDPPNPPDPPGDPGDPPGDPGDPPGDPPGNPGDPPGFPVPDPWPPGDPIDFGATGIPDVSINPGKRCAHSTGPLIYEGVLTPEGIKGTWRWRYGGKVKFGRIVSIWPDFVNKPGEIFLDFMPDGTDITVTVSASIGYCAQAKPYEGEEEDDDGGDGMLAGLCPHTLSCSGHWCHACATLTLHLYHSFPDNWPYTYPWYCPLCGWPDHWWWWDYGCRSHYPCLHLEELSGDDGDPGEGSVRAKTRYHRGFPDDMACFYPIPGSHSGYCCPCPEHAGDRITEGKLASASGGISYQRKTVNGTNVTFQAIAVGSTVYSGEAVYIKGTAHSFSPWDMTGRFTWEEHGKTKALTNSVTVASMRVMPHIGDGVSDADCVAARLALPPEGWAVPADPGTLLPVRLYADAHMYSDQHITLSLDGTPGAFRVWLEESDYGNGPPLLVPGQTVTNGMPFTFAGSSPVVVWLEVLAPGSAQITYAFEGFGPAKGLSHSDTLNITTAGVHITMKNAPPFIPYINQPPFDGTPGKKLVFATFPEPQQTNIVWDVRLSGKTSGTARLLYQRGAGAETEIQWGNGGPHTLQFVNGWLNASVCLNDGPEPSPAMTLTSGVIIVSGVLQGDKIIAEETGSGWRDEIAVVKNFSWNDLQRLGPGNLTMHPDFNGLLPEIKDAIIGTILFCMDTSPTREQKTQLNGNTFTGSGSRETLYYDLRSNHPNLLTLEIPSARSVGTYPWDIDHFHLALETYPLPPTIVTQMDTIGNVLETVKNEPFLVQHAASHQILVDLMNSAYGFPNETPFMLFHTYEERAHFSPAYYNTVPSATAYLFYGDPIRNVRWTFPNDQHPWLTYPGQDTNAEFRNGDGASPQQVWYISFFVDRKGRVVLFPRDMGSSVLGMKSDALREE